MITVKTDDRQEKAFTTFKIDKELKYLEQKRNSYKNCYEHQGNPTETWSKDMSRELKERKV